MLEIKKNIIINTSIDKVWSFLLSMNYSMLMNRSHTKVDFPSDFTPEINSSFVIHQSFAIVKFDFESKIVRKVSFEKLTISKTMMQKPTLTHSITYKMKIVDKSVELACIFNGDLGKKIIEVSLQPIIHGIMIDELRNIKSAVESSNYISPFDSKSKKLKPI